MIQTENGKTYYINNKQLLLVLSESNEKGRMSDELAKMLQLLCKKYATIGKFVGYTYNEDMQAYAMSMLVKTWHRFDVNIGDNPFAFFTQCIKNSFKQYLNLEKKQRTVRDLLLVNQGLNPSYGYDDDSDQHFVEDEQDYYQIKDTHNALQSQLSFNDLLLSNENIDELVDKEFEIEENQANIDE